MKPPLHSSAARLPHPVWDYPNIAGCFLGLLGLSIHFQGLVGQGWPWMVAALYALGWLAAYRWRDAGTPAAMAPPRRKPGGIPLLAELDGLIDEAGLALPMEARRLLHSIRANLAQLIPRLADSALYSQETHTVESTIRRYLPATLANYLRLPPEYARNQILSQGKTARDLLVEQLALLDGHLQKLLKNVLEDDARALLANGRFLTDKFKSQDIFNLEDDT